MAKSSHSKKHIPMNHPSLTSTTCRLRLSAAAVAFLAAAALTGCAAPATTTGLSVPAALNPPPSEVLVLETQARGVQVYQCAATKTGDARFDWNFVRPEAQLFDAAGRNIGRHFAGPSWEANDHSVVVGEVKAKDPGPSAGTIPWLLLGAKSNTGAGVFANVRSVQRLATAGGLAPAGGCDASHAGEEMRVGYQAVYRFYAAAR